MSWCELERLVQEAELRPSIRQVLRGCSDDAELLLRARRLGYRITSTFVDRFLGRIFETPGAVFPEEILRPEKQDLAAFADGVDAICEAQKRVALNYFDDASVEAACPPIRALLHIMAFGEYEGRKIGRAHV